MKKAVAALVVILAIVAVAAIFSKKQSYNAVRVSDNETTGTTTSTDAHQTLATDTIEVDSPYINETVGTTVTITGKAKGWYFEAVFPVKVLDANGTVIAQGQARAQGDWMTADFVPFSATLTFSEPTTATGTIVLAKDNPSGLPQNDVSVSLPVRFSSWQ